MTYVSRFKIILILLLGFIANVFVWPNFVPQENWPSWLPYKRVVLGLDLRGGVQLSLEMETKQLMKDQYNQLTSALRRVLKEHKIAYRNLMFDEEGVRLTLSDPAAAEILDKALQGQFGKQFLKNIQGKMVRFSYTRDYVANLCTEAQRKSIEVITRRVDRTGAVDPLVQAAGPDKVVMQLPGFQDPGKVREALGKTAKLSFQWVYDPKYQTGGSGTRSVKDFKSGRDYVVENELLLTGEDVANARADYSVNEKSGAREPAVNLSLTSKGSRVFSDLTRNFQGRGIAIILDDTVLSAPQINQHISSGRAMITGYKQLDEAQELAVLIRSGSLPVPLKVLEEKVVGPGLGQDSIQAGAQATVGAVVVVSLFMVLAYSFFGLFAVVGVLFNILFLVAAMSLLGATLTLPGIAGIALTVGMAVDANVLINERIKEEIRLGRKVAAAVDSGYRRAMSSIVDSNVTGLIGAIMLYALGTGPVKGFALTLGVGILISMFTALSLTRVFVGFWLQRRHIRALPI